jgi:hypothetical protein
MVRNHVLLYDIMNCNRLKFGSNLQRMTLAAAFSNATVHYRHIAGNRDTVHEIHVSEGKECHETQYIISHHYKYILIFYILNF